MPDILSVSLVGSVGHKGCQHGLSSGRSTGSTKPGWDRVRLPHRLLYGAVVQFG